MAPRLVLTAAHCLPPSIDPSDYSVFVGDEVVGAESLAVHPDYDENAPYEEAARYDLGMIKLSTPITGAAPVPILTGGRLSTNQTYYLAGYGANEKTSDTTRTWRDDFKFGATTLDNKDEFLILGSHISLGTSTCAGDSGGPATLRYGRYIVLVGVASVGLNDLDQGECILVDDGSFAHVDLQSSTSKAFLSGYPAIVYVSHGMATVAGAADTAASTLRKATRGTTLAKLKQEVRAQRAALASAATFAEGTTASLMQRALKALQAVSAARSLSIAKLKVKMAMTSLGKLSALGMS